MNGERGFTLVELLVTMVLGLVVVGGVFTLVMTSQRASRRIADRTDATQRGRIALNAMTQEMRAMVCLNDATPTKAATKPVISATDTQFTWYANLDRDATVDANGDLDPTYDPQARRLTVTSDATGLTGIREDVWTAAVLPTNLDVTPNRSRVLISALEPVVAGIPVFRYYGYVDGDAAEPELPLVSPVANPERIARIDIAYLARPASAGGDPKSTSVMETSVYARTVDRVISPTNPFASFACAS